MHLVDNGATRPVTLTGVPDGVQAFRVFVTDAERGMEEGDLIRVEAGEAPFTLDATSYTTLISAQ